MGGRRRVLRARARGEERAQPDEGDQGRHRAHQCGRRRIGRLCRAARSSSGCFHCHRHREPGQPRVPARAAHFERGELSVASRARYRLEDVANAHRDLETGHGRGKVVIVVAP
ncbi:zinc-binding dehydrogenase [Acrocarpospora pleiomorpha]|uniref:zinc-binding dehydrogenase n=1 Tax=Acrocarpospora pleiomorpha TaxID=90975 RepID=UPI0035A25F94